MNLKYYFNAFTLSLIGLGLMPYSASAVSLDFVQLLDNVIQHQPEQQTTKGIAEVHSANQSLSDSWISGDVDLIVHHENDTLTDNNDYKNWEVGVEFPIWLPLC